MAGESLRLTVGIVERVLMGKQRDNRSVLIAPVGNSAPQQGRRARARACPVLWAVSRLLALVCVQYASLEHLGQRWGYQRARHVHMVATRRLLPPLFVPCAQSTRIRPMKEVPASPIASHVRRGSIALLDRKVVRIALLALILQRKGRSA